MKQIRLLPVTYPETVAERNRWIRERRGARNRLDPWRPYASLWEEEVGAASGDLIPTATIFLTNRECPYRCLMCDLWKNTLEERVPVGAIPAQIEHALAGLPPARQIKLYNAGSFFDPAAIPLEDYPQIARLTAGFERVIVECHPALVGDRCLQFRDLVAGELEVALGLETAHPQVLERLNKQVTVESFRRAADLLAREKIALRVFLLVRPPFLEEAQGVAWARRSLEVAFDAGASVCCLIPTRGGNGAMEALAATGHFAPPSLPSMEAAQEYGLHLKQGRVFSDLWDIEHFYTCPSCSSGRAERLAAMNRTQEVPPPISCDQCGGGSSGDDGAVGYLG